ncbi:MAG: hypothetical protein P1U40_01450 [Coxiellaceae bacterium]|nr:hypothetical protein [Coxiellaceae bacterium]
MKFIHIFLLSVALLVECHVGFAANAYATGECDLNSPVCTFRINLSCPAVKGTYESNDTVGDFIFWTSRGDNQPVKVDGHFDYPDFSYYAGMSTYACVRVVPTGKYDFTYRREVNLLDEVKVYFDQHDPYIIQCSFVNNDPTQGTLCSAEA